jgi:hypothetical protein
MCNVILNGREFLVLFIMQFTQQKDMEKQKHQIKD